MLGCLQLAREARNEIACFGSLHALVKRTSFFSLNHACSLLGFKFQRSLYYSGLRVYAPCPQTSQQGRKKNSKHAATKQESKTCLPFRNRMSVKPRSAEICWGCRHQGQLTKNLQVLLYIVLAPSHWPGRLILSGWH